MFRRWAEGTLQSVVGALIIALIPGAAVTYLSHIQSAWATPVLLGLAAAALATIIILSLDAIRRLPPRRVIPSTTNIESCVRDWLNNFQYSVKKSPQDNTYFRYLVTVDSGTKMLVGRTKGDFQDYVQIRADVVPGPSDLEQIASLGLSERAALIGNIRLELARRKIGYRNLGLPANDTYIFKHIPIRESLTEHEFIAALDEVEGAAHSIGLVFVIQLMKTGKLSDESIKRLTSQ
ncbi:MAG TPA: DUF2299 family protein [Candidatus Sulfotelmatobacter sp.]